MSKLVQAFNLHKRDTAAYQPKTMLRLYLLNLKAEIFLGSLIKRNSRALF